MSHSAGEAIDSDLSFGLGGITDSTLVKLKHILKFSMSFALTLAE